MARKTDLDRQHAQTVKRLLASEAAAVSLIKRPVSAASARVRDAVSRDTGNPRRSLLAAIQHNAGQLRSDARGATLAARAAARHYGREQLNSDLLPMRQWASRNLRQGPPTPGIIPHAAALDAFEADRVASSIHAVWGSSLLARFNIWDKKGGKGNLSAALDTDRIIEPRLTVHASTQAASAFADERQSFWDSLAENVADFGGLFGSPPGAANDDGEPSAPALFHVWSAVLDRRTCEDCAALDGSTVPIDEEFEAGAETPLHPSCRCVILTTFDEDALDGTDNRTAVGDQVKSATIPSLMKQF